MGHQRFHYLSQIILFGFFLFCGGCATVNVPDVGSKDYRIEDDEQRIINRSDEVIDAIEDAGYLYPDRELEAYLNDIAQRLIPPDLKADPKINIRIKVLRDPVLNAFAFTNGVIYVHTGIIAAAENEDQIATILGHEMTHVLHRHMLKQFRSLQNKALFWSTIGLSIDVVTGGISSLFVQLSFLSSVSGFSQSLEFDADEGGFAMIKSQGYNTRESVKVFERLGDFTKDEEIKEPFFFSSHPKILERIEKYKELNAADPSPAAAGTEHEKFLQITRQLKLDNIDLCLERGFFKTAERNIKIYTGIYPQDAQGWFRQAELFRRRQDLLPKTKKRDKTTDYPKALELYDKTLALDGHLSEAWLGKARVLQKMSRSDEAKTSFKRYLELKPDSRERAYIEQFINTPENSK